MNNNLSLKHGLSLEGLSLWEPFQTSAACARCLGLCDLDLDIGPALNDGQSLLGGELDGLGSVYNDWCAWKCSCKMRVSGKNVPPETQTGVSFLFLYNSSRAVMGGLTW